MKNRYISRFGLFLVFVVFLFSCTKEEGPSYSYFVSKEQKRILTSSYINNFINEVSGLYPDINSFRGSVLNDITIYKLVYHTEIKGEQINASGLLCVPSQPGEYPVLSFQNGTNTIASQAPSNFDLNPALQMVELISSMGYIVMIPDYPGFGASADIPHPYLVKEPTVRSIVDMFFATSEIAGEELNGIKVKNEYYLLGYSQGGWATLALHEALEQRYQNDFNLAGSACGAGPYNIYSLFQGMVSMPTYPMPVYFAYILNAYDWYEQFTNPVTDIMKEPYAGRLGSLFNGNLTLGQINNQLTTSIPDLLQPGFITGFSTDARFSSVKEAMVRNRIKGWNTKKPLYLMHGSSDTHVSPTATANIYNEMIAAGTSPGIISKEIFPGMDHSDAALPGMIKGFLFLKGLRK